MRYSGHIVLGSLLRLLAHGVLINTASSTAESFDVLVSGSPAGFSTAVRGPRKGATAALGFP